MVPVTARLSQRFYEKLGDDVANELVEWFNAVDLAYRTELRELNEINFARFDAKLEQRIAELRAELRQEIGVLRAELHQEIAALRQELHQEIAALRQELHQEIAALRQELHEQIGGLRVDMQALRGGLLRWMFGFWVTTLLALAGLTATLLTSGFGR